MTGRPSDVRGTDPAAGDGSLRALIGAPVACAWSTATDGDLRADLDARARFAARVGAPTAWATVSQVHGATVVTAAEARAAEDRGHPLEADGIVVAEPGEAAAVFTADCLGVVIAAEGGGAVAHAGWRGLVAGVLAAAVAQLHRHVGRPLRAAIGPGIGPCCFEVGPEVAERFDPAHRSATTRGTPSVDLRSAAAAALAAAGVDDVEQVGGCTRCGAGYHSHRRDRTLARMAALVWLPTHDRRR